MEEMRDGLMADWEEQQQSSSTMISLARDKSITW